MPISWPHPVELFVSPQDSPYNDDDDNYDGDDNDDNDDDIDDDDDYDGNSTRLICDRDGEKNMNVKS